MSSCWRTGDAWLASKKTQGVCCGSIHILNTAKLPVSKHPLLGDVMVALGSDHLGELPTEKTDLGILDR